jgi:hypothetical protein
MSATWGFGIVAFLDVLGFAQLVESDARAPVPTHLDRLLNSFAEARSFIPAGTLNLRSFSDSIIIAGDLSGDGVVAAFRSVVGLQRVLLRNGVLVRGGLAFGKHFADADSMYSEALVKAYKLERDQARFPRVLVSQDLLGWFEHEACPTDEMKQEAHDLLLRDRDDGVFLHYLNADLLEIHAAVVRSYNVNGTTASLLDKIQWLAAYNNFVAELGGQQHMVSGPLVAGFRRLP